LQFASLFLDSLFLLDNAARARQEDLVVVTEHELAGIKRLRGVEIGLDLIEARDNVVRLRALVAQHFMHHRLVFVLALRRM
jgi:hypothetical protein